MRRYDMLPSYHFEDSVNGIIEKPVEPDMRDYVIEGNCGKNLIPYPYAETTKTVNGVTFTDNGDGTITANGTATQNAYFIYYRNLENIIDITKKYVLSGSSDAVVSIVLYQNGTWKREVYSRYGNSIIVDFPSYTDIEYNEIVVRTYVPSGKTVNNAIVKPQLEIGDTATEYEPYKTVGDKTENGKYKLPIVVGGKNELAYPYDGASAKTENGITFTSNKDGSVTANGTATSNAFYYCRLSSRHFKLDKNKRYFLSGCPSGSASTYLMTCDFYNDTKWVTSNFAYNQELINPSLYDYNCNNIGIKVMSGATLDNVVFKPMLQDITDLPNLIPYPYYSTTKTVNGVTFTDNGDGSITVNGTNTGTDKITLYVKRAAFSKGTYVLSGCPIGGSNTTYFLTCDIQKDDNTWLNSLSDIGNGSYKDLSPYDGTRIYMYIIIRPNITVENLVFKPKLVKISTDYEPYITPTTTNIIRDSPLKPGESISYRADKLPSVTLKKNVTNTVKVDTEIQPKSVKCQYYTY